MKKFFELGLTNRKSVTGKTIITGSASSLVGDELGKLEVKMSEKELHKGIFVKYTPCEGMENSTTNISSIVFSGEDDEAIKDFLEITKNALLDSDLNSKHPQYSNTFKMLYSCILPEHNMFVIPGILLMRYDVKVTNTFITSYTGDGWLGIELKYSAEVKERLDAMKKEEELKAKRYADFLSSLAHQEEKDLDSACGTLDKLINS